MRLFQNSGLYRSYAPRLAQLTRSARSFDERIDAFLKDRFGAPHFLLPVLQRDPQAFFTNGDDDVAQRIWAREHGLPAKSSVDDILLAQIEEHRTEVFYNLDPLRFGSAFVRRLPGSVRHSIAWRAAPSPGADFGAYHKVICNFPSILESYRQAGWKAAYFAPAHDPVMDAYAANRDRPIDILFVGGYSRHHRRRAEFLAAIAQLRSSHAVHMHLDSSRLTQLAESPIGAWLPLGKHRRPRDILAVARPPVFGLDLYEALSRAKIVVNGAIDMAADDRGNMRCFESMGCACALVSDAGRYPQGMSDPQTLLTYASADEAVARIRHLLASPSELEGLAAAGHRMISERYSKARQWAEFQGLVQ